MKHIFLHRDCMGATVSGLCLIHCIVWPLIPSLFPSLIPFLASLFLVPHDTLWESLHLVEYVFWSMAFLATFFSLRRLLKPHHCPAHHPLNNNDKQETEGHLVPKVSSKSSRQYQFLQSGRLFKYIALGCACVAWLWLMVVAILSLPHLYSLMTSVLLIGSHVSALLFSVKESKSSSHTLQVSTS